VQKNYKISIEKIEIFIC